MNELKVFTRPKFGRVRTVEIDGEPWLVGKDVAEALGYSNPWDALKRHVDDEDKDLVKYETLGGAQEMTVINEFALYSLVLSSKLPGARKFRRWVTGEVLPSIRKNGGYIRGQDDMTPDELFAAALVYAKKKIQEYDMRIASMTVQNQIMAPKAEYFDELVERNTLTSFRETAKELGLKEKTHSAMIQDKRLKSVKIGHFQHLRRIFYVAFCGCDYRCRIRFYCQTIPWGTIYLYHTRQQHCSAQVVVRLLFKSLIKRHCGCALRGNTPIVPS